MKSTLREQARKKGRLEGRIFLRCNKSRREDISGSLKIMKDRLNDERKVPIEG